MVLIKIHVIEEKKNKEIMCLTEVYRETRFSLGFTFTVSTEDGLCIGENTSDFKFFNITIMLTKNVF